MGTYYSPAKINLFLRIMGKRPDKYHEIASLFQTISLHDVLSFSFADEDKLLCTDPEIPNNSDNLIFKAADLFRKKTNLKFGIRVELKKNIPSQAGLGGGSSNAATTLWALNDLFKRPFSTEQLASLAAEIGSDVAFFLSQGTAYCTGRGEILRELPALPHNLSELMVLKPQEGLSTPEVFRALRLQDCSTENPELLLQEWLKGHPVYVNDLEKPALEARAEIKKFKQDMLELGFSHLVMTGSGSAFFALGQNFPQISDSKIFSKRARCINRPENSWYLLD